MPMITGESFVEFTLEEFASLAHQCNLAIWHSRSDAAAVEVFFVKPPTALKVGLEWRERALYVEFFRSSGKGSPPDVLQQDGRFSFDDLLLLRAPGVSIPRLRFDDGADVNSVRPVLSFYADALSVYAADVLNGDWTVYSKVAKLMEQRQRHWREENEGEV
jgi:hypothetical protein